MSRLLPLSALFSLLFTIPAISQTTIPGGAVSGVWTIEGSPYKIEGNILLPSNSFLTIGAGVEVVFRGDFSFEVQGELLAEGTETDTVRFIPGMGVDTWRGLDFVNATSSSSFISYCKITGSDNSGIDCYYSDVNISHCEIISNSRGAWCGGGIYCRYSDPEISYCTIDGNSANYGGGIYSGLYSHPYIFNCTIINNTGWYGGAIYCAYSGSAQIIECEIKDNTVISSGGGIYCTDYSTTSILSCIISNNFSLNGGGICCADHTVADISFCTIIGNSAERGGGVSCRTSSQPEISNCTIYENSASEYGSGIYCGEDSNPYLTNSIISDNAGGYGIYFDSGSYEARISYCNIFNNTNGEIGGSIPYLLGQITTFNINGDSCDTYYNIFENSLFINPGMGNFHLRPGSPCINAGDPTTTPDPDSTIADIGAFSFQSIITVELILISSPVIPWSGDSLDFAIELSNTSENTLTFDLWLIVLVPGVGPIEIFHFLDVTLYPHCSIERDYTQYIPAQAPEGTYAYYAYIGDYPGGVEDSDHFNFEKQGIGPETPWLSNSWLCSVEGFDPWYTTSSFKTPQKFNLVRNYPNPFNLTTVLSFELRVASHVTLTVYDVAGREVARLVDGQRDAGIHEVTFDGSNLSSGIYVYRLTAGEFSRVGKMALLK